MKTCFECGCVDSSDNPIIGFEDEFGNIEEWLCLECSSSQLEWGEQGDED